jgi:predicted nucleic acid-binding protein
MIVVDANVLLLVMSRPSEPVNLWMHESAKRLFESANRGEVELYVPTAVIAEVIFVLTSRANYGLDEESATRLLEPFLKIEALHIENKAEVVHALSLWNEYPKLGFVDALVAAIAMRPGGVLASFDNDFRRLGGIDRYQWEHAPDR